MMRINGVTGMLVKPVNDVVHDLMWYCEFLQDVLVLRVYAEAGSQLLQLQIYTLYL